VRAEVLAAATAGPGSLGIRTVMDRPGPIGIFAAGTTEHQGDREAAQADAPVAAAKSAEAEAASNAPRDVL